jgi:primosomal protein DnaI
MGAIANKLSEQGHSVYFVHVPTFCREIKASISDQSYIGKIAELENVDCLILDDIGAESFSPWLRDEVLGPIIQYRTQNEKPILYTSNLDYDNLRTHLAESSHSQVDELKAYRIAERIRSFTVPYKMYGENRRR